MTDNELNCDPNSICLKKERPLNHICQRLQALYFLVYFKLSHKLGKQNLTMMVYFIKFIHVTTIITLFGWTISNATKPPGKLSLAISLSLITLMLIAILTGSYLIHPTGFSTSTPWIKAAISLSTITLVLLVIQTFCRNKLPLALITLALLTLIIKDAVFK